MYTHMLTSVAGVRHASDPVEYLIDAGSLSSMVASYCRKATGDRCESTEP